MCVLYIFIFKERVFLSMNHATKVFTKFSFLFIFDHHPSEVCGGRDGRGGDKRRVAYGFRLGTNYTSPPSSALTNLPT